MSETMTITKDDVGTLDAGAAPAEPKKSKHPELEAMLAKLVAERDAIMATTADKRAKRTALYEKLKPIQDEVRALEKEIHAAEQPKLNDLNRQIVGLQKAVR